jgi:hypothetical protein
MTRLMTKAIGHFAVAACASALLSGCDATRIDEGSCWQRLCDVDHFCNGEHRCVARLDAGESDSRQSVDVVPAVEVFAVDAPVVVDLGRDAAVPQAIDAAIDVAVDVEPDVTIVDVAIPVDVAVDTFIPDAPGTCAIDGDCPTPGLPFCVDGRCVACKTGEQCKGGAPICSADHACVSCALADAGCPAVTPACEADSGRCVECLADVECKGAPDKSFCVAGACVGCTTAAADACAKRDPSNPACLAGGICVECAANDDCTVATKPICDTTTHLCKPCVTDSECESKPGGPGVCMAQQDGRCATDAETIYVASPSGSCPASATGSGSADAPYCSLQIAVTAAKSRSVPLLVLSGSIVGGFTGVSLSAPLTVVGKNAVITPASGADGISILGGELFLRNITIRGSASTSTGTGISAAATGGNPVVLHLDTCAVIENPGGGIFLNGAAFTIKNTTVIRNGPNSTGWGGIQVQNPPAAGPTTLSQVTLSDNKQVGLACNASLAATNAGSGVLATGNVGGIDISSTCGVVACVAAGPSCGAQTAP